MKTRNIALTALLAALLSPAWAGTLVELSAEASRPAANDQTVAVVYAEASATDPAELARKINHDIGEAMQLIRSKPEVTVKSGNQQTYPVYGTTRKIDSWRMRSELILETMDGAAIAELLARLQKMKLALANVSQSPSPATRSQIETSVTQDAIRAFEKRATVVADTLGKTYRIKRLSVQLGGIPAPAPMPMLRSARLESSADMAPAPLEAGESMITVNVSGEIELAD